jgi:hypothetical protein
MNLDNGSYADVLTTDPLSAQSAGLLDRLSAPGVMPKIISTNSAAEYWRGDATLAHVDTSGERDLAEHQCARSYLFASAQHVPGYIGQSRINAAVHTKRLSNLTSGLLDLCRSEVVLLCWTVWQRS